MSVYIFALGIKSANGLVKSTINTANALSDRGVDVTIINIIGKNGGLEFLDPGFSLNKEVNRISLDALSLEYSNPKLDNTILHVEDQEYLKAKYTGAHRKALQNLNQNLTCNDLIIFSHPLAMVVFSKANPETAAKTIIQVHGNYIEEVDNLSLLEGYMSYVDHIQTVSKDMKVDLEKILPNESEKIICIHNITRPVKNLRKVKSSYKRISIVGSIQKRKNQLDAIRMLSCIQDQNVILQIYGHSLKKEYISRLNLAISNLGLENRVVFKGVASEREVYENTDIVVMTSEHEGYPYIFFESAVYSVPIISYDFKYGAKEFSQNNENGCLTNMGDYKRMAEIVEELFNNSNLYSKVVNVNQQFFEREYSEASIVDSYLSLFVNNNNNKSAWITERSYDALDISDLKLESVSEEIFEPWSSKPYQKDFYQVSVKIKGDLQNAEFYYVYKKSKFPIEVTLNNIQKPSFFRSFIDNTSDNARVIKLNIPKVNRVSMGMPLKNFDVMINKNGYEECIASVIDSSLKNNVKNSMIKNYFGSLAIKDIPHILKPDGFYIRYPSLDAIRMIINEKGERLEFITKVMKFYGKEYVFFKLQTGLYKSIKVLMNSGNILEIQFNNYSYSSVFNKINELENSYKLFDLKISDIYIWELIRVTIFEQVLEAVGVLDKHFSTPSVVSNEYFGTKNINSVKDVSGKKLIFEFPRKGDIDYKTISIKKMFKDNSVVFEYPQKTGYSDEVYDIESHTYPVKDFLDFSKVFKKDIKFSTEENINIKWLKKMFISELGIEIEFNLYLKSRILKYLKEFTYFNEHFKLHKYDEVLIPSAYWSSGIISAAKANGVITSDIQYAVISKYHPSFSFSQPARAYGPDRVYLWSKYWNISELTYNKSFIMDGNYFSEKVEAFKVDKLQSYEYDLAFVSQSRIGRRVFNFALEFATNYPNKKIIFCPHPDENYSLYPKYHESVNVTNLVINTQHETLKEIYRSQHVVGVYSTSLIEALALEKSVFILKVSGYELYEKELNKGFMKLVESPEDLFKHIVQEADVYKENYFSKLFFNHV